ISAMPMMLAQNPDIRLLLVGGGPAEDALRAQVDASPAAHAICFAGRVPHDEVEQYYSLIDILVYPRKAMRLTETVTPLKPLEAMAQGRLVAASDVGGHRELIADRVTGTLFAPDSPAAIARSLADLVAARDSWDTRRQTARAFVAEERNWARNVERYQPVYQAMLDDRASTDIFHAA
ncbi:MAG: glycosyltransferase family 4 protein, partial [Blastomonas sp.]|nr:glycosyltransferase family 4 protein [Blastomonas sp.]